MFVSYHMYRYINVSIEMEVINTGGTGRGKDEIRDIKRGPAANMPVYKKGATGFLTNN